MEEVYKVKEVAAIFKVHHKTVYTWIAKGKIECVRLPSGSVRISRKEVDRLLLGK